MDNEMNLEKRTCVARDAVIGVLIFVIAILILNRTNHPENKVPPLPQGCLFPPDSMDDGLRWRCVIGAAARGCALGSQKGCELEQYMHINEAAERLRFATEHDVWLSANKRSDQ